MGFFPKGIVTTARITHATPGATYAHVTNRDYEADSNLPREKQASCQDIAHQLINSEAGKKLKVRTTSFKISFGHF